MGALTGDPVMRYRTVLISLLKDYPVVTDSDNDTTADLEVPELEGLMPYAESVELMYVVTEAAASDISWNFDVYYGMDRNHEAAAPVDLLAANITTVAPNRVASTITSDKYQMHWRLRLKYKRATASGTRRARITAILLVKTVGQ
jgi:hypothetical protein